MESAMKAKDWAGVILAILGLLGVAGSVAVWAGDQHWVVASTFTKALKQMDINSLDRQITFLQIKIDEDEATRSETIYIKTLKQQLRSLQN